MSQIFKVAGTGFSFTSQKVANLFKELKYYVDDANNNEFPRATLEKIQELTHFLKLEIPDLNDLESAYRDFYPGYVNGTSLGYYDLMLDVLLRDDDKNIAFKFLTQYEEARSFLEINSARDNDEPVYLIDPIQPLCREDKLRVVSPVDATLKTKESDINTVLDAFPFVKYDNRYAQLYDHRALNFPSTGVQNIDGFDFNNSTLIDGDGRINITTNFVPYDIPGEHSIVMIVKFIDGQGATRYRTYEAAFSIDEMDIRTRHLVQAEERLHDAIAFLESFNQATGAYEDLKERVETILKEIKKLAEINFKDSIPILKLVDIVTLGDLIYNIYQANLDFEILQSSLSHVYEMKSIPITRFLRFLFDEVDSNGTVDEGAYQTELNTIINDSMLIFRDGAVQTIVRCLNYKEASPLDPYEFTQDVVSVYMRNRMAGADREAFWGKVKNALSINGYSNEIRFVSYLLKDKDVFTAAEITRGGYDSDFNFVIDTSPAIDLYSRTIGLSVSEVAFTGPIGYIDRDSEIVFKHSGSDGSAAADSEFEWGILYENTFPFVGQDISLALAIPDPLTMGPVPAPYLFGQVSQELSKRILDPFEYYDGDNAVDPFRNEMVTRYSDWRSYGSHEVIMFGPPVFGGETHVVYREEVTVSDPVSDPDLPITDENLRMEIFAHTFAYQDSLKEAASILGRGDEKFFSNNIEYQKKFLSIDLLDRWGYDIHNIQELNDNFKPINVATRQDTGFFAYCFIPRAEEYANGLLPVIAIRGSEVTDKENIYLDWIESDLNLLSVGANQFETWRTSIRCAFIDKTAAILGDASPRFITCGHSLGGALTQLLATDHGTSSNIGEYIQKVYGFQSPGISRAYLAQMASATISNPPIEVHYHLGAGDIVDLGGEGHLSNYTNGGGQQIVKSHFYYHLCTNGIPAYPHTYNLLANATYEKHWNAGLIDGLTEEVYEKFDLEITQRKHLVRVYDEYPYPLMQAQAEAIRIDVKNFATDLENAYDAAESAVNDIYIGTKFMIKMHPLYSLWKLMR